MGLVYLAALIVGLGILAVQVALGSKDHGPDDHGHADSGDGGGLFAVILSVRFWVFASLAFGLSGSLLHLLEVTSPLVVGIIASCAGIGSGVFALAVFGFVRRTSTVTTTLASDAKGQIGRVLIACGPGRTGQVRVELGGQSVDLLAKTDETIARGEAVLVEDVEGSTARVSRRPDDLG